MEYGIQIQHATGAPFRDIAGNPTTPSHDRLQTSIGGPTRADWECAKQARLDESAVKGTGLIRLDMFCTFPYV